MFTRRAMLFCAIITFTRHFSHTPPLNPQIKDSELCIQARPDWVKGYFRKAAALEAQNLPDEAEKAFSLALKCEPANGYVT